MNLAPEPMKGESQGHSGCLITAHCSLPQIAAFRLFRKTTDTFGCGLRRPLNLNGVAMSGGSVLIVDSDRGSVRRLTELMSDLPLEVSIASSKGEAIEMSLQSRFDLCLISHGLVDGNGLSLFAESLNKRSGTTGVLLSRQADLRVVVEALDAGFSHVVDQPIETDQIRLILARLFPELKMICSASGCSCERSNLMQCEGEVPDLKSIASLSMSAIRFSMSTADLIRIIRSVDYPFAGKERLEYFDRDTLERVVCLVRRWSQQRLAASGKLPAQSVNSWDELSASEASSPVKVPA